MWAVKREKDGEIIAMCSTLKDAEAMACKDLGHGIHYTIEEMEADHIKPWHLGGKTTADNCQMLSKEANREKGGK